MITAKDMGSVFALARYAAEKAKPLVDRIPGGCLSIDVKINDSWQHEPWHVSISVHRQVKIQDGRDLAPMPLQASVLVDTGDVDRAIDKLRHIVEDQSWLLHDAERAAA